MILKGTLGGFDIMSKWQGVDKATEVRLWFPTTDSAVSYASTALASLPVSPLISPPYPLLPVPFAHWTTGVVDVGGPNPFRSTKTIPRTGPTKAEVACVAVSSVKVTASIPGVSVQTHIGGGGGGGVGAGAG